MARSVLSFLALLVAIVAIVDCFSPGWVSNSATKLNARKPSRVSDPSGPTVEMEPEELPEIDYDSLEETKFNEANIPIPNQPWRRGETAGCEAPIDAEWRKEAERMIEMGVQMAGGTYIDTTWYLTSVVVTIGMDFQEMKTDLLRAGGPEVRIDTSSKPIYYDPDDPEPEDIWYSEDEDTPFYERDDEAEKAIANRTYAKADVEEGESDSPESLGLDPSGKNA